MADLATILFSISGGLTLMYYIIKSFLTSRPTILKIITYMYYILLLTGISSAIYADTKSTCGEIQWLPGLVYGILPWLLIFIAFSLLLAFFPGWKSPFSNTFGYAYAKIKGASTVINNIINTTFKSKDIQDIYNDPSMLVNTITPNNFDDAISRLVRDKIFNPMRTNYQENVESLRQIVTVKDDVAECIWKLLVAGLISSMSASQIANVECNYSEDQMRSNQAKHQEKQQKQAQEDKDSKTKQYFVRD